MVENHFGRCPGSFPDSQQNTNGTPRSYLPRNTAVRRFGTFPASFVVLHLASDRATPRDRALAPTPRDRARAPRAAAKQLRSSLAFELYRGRGRPQRNTTQLRCPPKTRSATGQPGALRCPAKTRSCNATHEKCPTATPFFVALAVLRTFSRPRVAQIYVPHLHGDLNGFGAI